MFTKSYKSLFLVVAIYKKPVPILIYRFKLLNNFYKNNNPYTLSSKLYSNDAKLLPEIRKTNQKFKRKIESDDENESPVKKR